MVNFLFGMFVGSILTVIILGFCAIAVEDEDQELEEHMHGKEK